MRKHKTIKVDDNEITVHELRVRDIRQLMDIGDDMEGKPLADAIPEALKLCTDLPADRLEDMAPSEIQTVWEAFREVNAVFFDLAAKSGMVDQLKAAFQTHLTEFAADSSSAAIKTPSTTGGASSKPASKKR